MSRPTNHFYKIEMLLLKIISVEKCYGYQIVQLMNKHTNGLVTIKEGTMYPILYRLLDNGLIVDEKVLVGTRQTRIYYKITDKGREYLKKEIEEYQHARIIIDNLLKWDGDKDE